MADGVDFDIERIRWAITTALVKTGNIINPPGAERDAGYAIADVPTSGEFNDRLAETYVALRYLVEDILGEFFPWNGLPPGEDELLIGPTGIRAGAGVREVAVPARRWWYDGELVSVAENLSVSYIPNLAPIGQLRTDRLVLEVTSGVGSYVTLPGTAGSPTPPVPAANQLPLARYNVDGFPSDATPFNFQLEPFFQARVRPQVKRYTVRMSYGHGIYRKRSALSTEVEWIDEEATDLNQAPTAFRIRTIGGVRGWAVFPVVIPPRGRCVAARVIGLKESPSTADEGYQVDFRSVNTATGAVVTIAAADNTGDPLSPLPYVIELDVDETANVPPVGDALAYQIEIISGINNDNDALNPTIWAVEYDIEVLSSNLVEV